MHLFEKRDILIISSTRNFRLLFIQKKRIHVNSTMTRSTRQTVAHSINISGEVLRVIKTRARRKFSNWSLLADLQAFRPFLVFNNNFQSLPADGNFGRWKLRRYVGKVRSRRDSLSSWCLMKKIEVLCVF